MSSDSDDSAASNPDADDPDTITLSYKAARSLWEEALKYRNSKNCEPQPDDGNKPMNVVQPLEDLKLTPFFLRSESCPLFRTYAQSYKYLGSGAYGFVLRLLKTNVASAGVDTQSAMKVQRVFKEELGDLGVSVYVELRLLHLLTQLTARWEDLDDPSLVPLPRNFPRLLDWVPCKFDARKKILPLLEKDDRDGKRRAERSLASGAYNYQLIVLEYAQAGTLESRMLGLDPRDVARMMAPPHFRAMVAQLFCTLHELGRLVKFTWHDAKAANILCQPLHARYSNMRWLAYLVKDPATGKDLNEFIVPLDDTGRMLYQISDFGIARAELQIAGNSSLEKISVTPKKMPFVSIYNQRDDTETFAISLLRSLIDRQGLFALGSRFARVFNKGVRGIDIETVRFLRKCIHQIPDTEQTEIEAALKEPNNVWALDKVNTEDFTDDADYTTDYAVISSIFDYLSDKWSIEQNLTVVKTAIASGDQFQYDAAWEAVRKRAVLALDRCYSIHRIKWSVKRNPADVDCLSELLTDSFFDPLLSKNLLPADLELVAKYGTNTALFHYPARFLLHDIDASKGDLPLRATTPRPVALFESLPPSPMSVVQTELPAPPRKRAMGTQDG